MRTTNCKAICSVGETEFITLDAPDVERIDVVVWLRFNYRVSEGKRAIVYVDYSTRRDKAWHPMRPQKFYLHPSVGAGKASTTGMWFQTDLRGGAEYAFKTRVELEGGGPGSVYTSDLGVVVDMLPSN